MMTFTNKTQFSISSSIGETTTFQLVEDEKEGTMMMIGLKTVVTVDSSHARVSYNQWRKAPVLHGVYGVLAFQIHAYAKL